MKRFMICLCFVTAFQWAGYSSLALATSTADSVNTHETATNRLLQLDNGLRLVAIEDSTSTLMQILSFYGVGSAQDPPGKEGLAHLLEHILADTWSPDPGDEQALKLLATYNNAYTSLAKTWYEAWCIPRLLPDVLRLQTGRLQQCDPLESVFARERFVVRQERALRDRGSASSDLLESIMQAAYAGHLYERPIAGTDSSIASIEIDDLKAFHRRYICPQNLTLVISGPVNADTIVALVRESFGTIPASPHFQPVEFPDPPAHIRTTAQIDRHDVENLLAMIGFRLPANSPRELFLGQLTCWLLSGPRTRESIVNMPKELFFSLRTSWLYSEDPYWHNPERLRQHSWEELWQTIQRRKATACRPDSFEVFRDRYLERSRTNRDFIESYGPDLLFLDEGSIVQRDSIIRSFNVLDVASYLDEYINSDNSSSGVVHGNKSKRRIPLDLDLSSLQHGNRWGAQAQAPDDAIDKSSIRPILSAIEHSPRRTIGHRTLSNGIPVFFIEYPGKHEVIFGGTRTFRTIKHAIKRPGLMCLYRLVVNYDPTPRAPDGKSLPYGVSFAPASQSMLFSGRVPLEKFDKLAKTQVTRMITQEFNVASWRRLREDPSYYLTPAKHSFDCAARVARWSALLGPKHPFLGESCGNAGDVKKWKYDHLRDIHKDMMKTGNLRLVATGSFDADSLCLQLKDSFGRMGRYKPRKKPTHSPAQLSEPFVTVVSAFDRRTCDITLTLQPVLPSSASGLDWATIEIVRECLHSKIYYRLRDREGLSYTVKVWAVRAGDDIMLEIRISTFPAATKQVLEVVLEEVNELAETGIGEDQFARAQLSATHWMLRTLDDPGMTFQVLQAMTLLGDPPKDPIAALLGADRLQCDAFLGKSLIVERPVISVCGPILEEESESLLATIGALE